MRQIESASSAEEALAELPPRHAAYLAEAQRLQSLYAPQIRILIGFESEWCRPSYGAYVTELASHPAVDYIIGSVHHVNGIPIDYDAALYAKARQSVSSETSGGEEALYERYFDQQNEMLTALQPRVVGHFDLIRLLSEDPARNLREWTGVWSRVVRNLEVARQHGALLECNSSGLRKGLAEPYPCRAVAEEWLRIGGRFTFSDDSHGTAQVATSYRRNADYLASLGVKEVWTFERSPAVGTVGSVKAELNDVAVPLSVFQETFS